MDQYAAVALPPDLWRIEYYGPLEERLRKLREKYRDTASVLLALDSAQQELRLFQRYSDFYGSVFLILRKD